MMWAEELLKAGRKVEATAATLCDLSHGSGFFFRCGGGLHGKYQVRVQGARSGRLDKQIASSTSRS